MDKLETLFATIVYIVSFILIYIFSFKNFGDLLWLKITLAILVAIVPTVILVFFFITIKRKTFKEETKILVYNVTGEPKKIDKIFFIVVYLLYIPALLIINYYPWAIGIPLILAGIYGLILGRIYIAGRNPFFHFHAGGFARIMGIMEIIIGILLSIVANKMFPLPI